MNPTLPPVLAAEDEESDAMILRLAFKKARLLNPLVVVRDGQDAVDYLNGAGPSTHPLPGLLILDLKMPRMSGFDVLSWLSTQPTLKALPAVVLSSSSDDSDIQKARKMGARDYFVKPHTLPQFIEIIQTLGARWLA